MELVICFALAVSAFVLLITVVVGLVLAPTPVLLAILVAGMMLTQKSINKFKVPEVKLEERDKDKIESIEVAVNPNEELVVKQNQQEIKTKKTLTSMTYRGFNYRRSPNLEKTTSAKSKFKIQYRGIKANQSENV